MGSIDLEKLKKMHKSGGALFEKPSSLECFDIPDELLYSWAEYLSAKAHHEKIMEKYGIAK